MNYNFHGSYTEERKNAFTSAQDEDLAKISKYLETDDERLRDISFEIFDTREGKQDADPFHSISRASARFAEMTIYRFWEQDNDPHYPHEITHLVAHTWAKPYEFETDLDTWDEKVIRKKIEMVSTSFMQEGLAIAVDDIVFQRMLLENGEHKYIDDWCREQMPKMPNTLESVINLEGFGSLPNKVVVPFAATFSKYLITTYGLDQYKRMYTSLKEILSSRENVHLIESEYNRSEEELIADWKRSITES